MPAKTNNRPPLTQHGKAYIAAYNRDNYKAITLRLSPNVDYELNMHSKAIGESKRAFISRAILEQIERDKEADRAGE